MHSKNKKFKHNKSKVILLVSSLFLFGSMTQASDLQIPNTFVANQPAVAAEVNANFDAVETSVDDNHSRLATLEASFIALQATINAQQNTITAQQATISELQSDLTAVENNTVLELDGLLQYALIDGHDTAEFTNVNVQINDGSGETDGPVNGKGNLTIGYNEFSNFALFFCSDPQYIDSVNCIGNLNTWDRYIKTGSHNLILGMGNSYTSYSSTISGKGNTSNHSEANVFGGSQNISAGQYSSILGGSFNRIIGEHSTITGGSFNTVSGNYSSISGGFRSEVISAYSNISGGQENTASGTYSSISGGYRNLTSEIRTSISGGEGNEATGRSSSISGGAGNTASGLNSSISGGLSNIASGTSSSVSGGNIRSATGTNDWVAGSLFEDN